MEDKDRHVRIIGKIFIVVGTLVLVITSFSFNFIHIIEEYLEVQFNDWSYSFGIFTLNHPPFGLLYFIPVFYLILAVLDIVVGFGLLAQKNWARITALFLALFLLFNFPFGTAFAIYIFYILLNDEVVAKIRMDKSSTPRSAVEDD